jgi:hypothetical protein
MTSSAGADIYAGAVMITAISTIWLGIAWVVIGWLLG